MIFFSDTLDSFLEDVEKSSSINSNKKSEASSCISSMVPERKESFVEGQKYLEDGCSLQAFVPTASPTLPNDPCADLSTCSKSTVSSSLISAGNGANAGNTPSRIVQALKTEHSNKYLNARNVLSPKQRHSGDANYSKIASDSKINENHSDLQLLKRKSPDNLVSEPQRAVSNLPVLANSSKWDNTEDIEELSQPPASAKNSHLADHSNSLDEGSSIEIDSEARAAVVSNCAPVINKSTKESFDSLKENAPSNDEEQESNLTNIELLDRLDIEESPLLDTAQPNRWDSCIKEIDDFFESHKDPEVYKGSDIRFINPTNKTVLNSPSCVGSSVVRRSHRHLEQLPLKFLTAIYPNGKAPLHSFLEAALRQYRHEKNIIDEGWARFAASATSTREEDLAERLFFPMEIKFAFPNSKDRRKSLTKKASCKNPKTLKTRHFKRKQISEQQDEETREECQSNVSQMRSVNFEPGIMERTRKHSSHSQSLLESDDESVKSTSSGCSKSLDKVASNRNGMTLRNRNITQMPTSRLQDGYTSDDEWRPSGYYMKGTNHDSTAKNIRNVKDKGVCKLPDEERERHLTVCEDSEGLEHDKTKKTNFRYILKPNNECIEKENLNTPRPIVMDFGEHGILDKLPEYPSEKSQIIYVKWRTLRELFISEEWNVYVSHDEKTWQLLFSHKSKLVKGCVDIRSQTRMHFDIKRVIFHERQDCARLEGRRTHWIVTNIHAMFPGANICHLMRDMRHLTFKPSTIRPEYLAAPGKKWLLVPTGSRINRIHIPIPSRRPWKIETSKIGEVCSFTPSPDDGFGVYNTELDKYVCVGPYDMHAPPHGVEVSLAYEKQQLYPNDVIFPRPGPLTTLEFIRQSVNHVLSGGFKVTAIFLVEKDNEEFDLEISYEKQKTSPIGCQEYLVSNIDELGYLVSSQQHTRVVHLWEFMLELPNGTNALTSWLRQELKLPKQQEITWRAFPSFVHFPRISRSKYSKRPTTEVKPLYYGDNFDSEATLSDDSTRKSESTLSANELDDLVFCGEYSAYEGSPADHTSNLKENMETRTRKIRKPSRFSFEVEDDSKRKEHYSPHTKSQVKFYLNKHGIIEMYKKRQTTKAALSKHGQNKMHKITKEDANINELKLTSKKVGIDSNSLKPLDYSKPHVALVDHCYAVSKSDNYNLQLNNANAINAEHCYATNINETANNDIRPTRPISVLKRRLPPVVIDSASRCKSYTDWEDEVINITEDSTDESIQSLNCITADQFHETQCIVSQQPTKAILIKRPQLLLQSSGRSMEANTRKLKHLYPNLRSGDMSPPLKPVSTFVRRVKFKEFLDSDSDQRRSPATASVALEVEVPCGPAVSGAADPEASVDRLNNCISPCLGARRNSDVEFSISDDELRLSLPEPPISSAPNTIADNQIEANTKSISTEQIVSEVSPNLPKISSLCNKPVPDNPLPHLNRTDEGTFRVPEAPDKSIYKSIHSASKCSESVSRPETDIECNQPEFIQLEDLQRLLGFQDDCLQTAQPISVQPEKESLTPEVPGPPVKRRRLKITPKRSEIIGTACTDKQTHENSSTSSAGIPSRKQVR